MTMPPAGAAHPASWAAMTAPPAPGILTITCRDRPGIVAAVADLIAGLGVNIVHADQHTDRATSTFLQRLELDGVHDWAPVDAAMAVLAASWSMAFRLHVPRRPARLVVLVSAQQHCAADLMMRVGLNELPAEVVGLLSDRPDAESLATRHDVPWTMFPKSDDPDGDHLRLGVELDRLDPDLVVLARYMRVLPEPLVEQWWTRMINIHHSFLPAFVGARPYHRAHDRGVKLIGATAHYVTAELDAGPIIAQDVERVSHRDEVADLVRIGRDVERRVLADAVRLHLEHRVLVFGNRTVVFD
jgi:formyltetrahydrofolate deformylase